MALAFAPALGLFFQADDFDWLRASSEAVARGGLALPADVNGHFRPLAEALWAIEFRAFGLSSGGYHAVALSLHGLTALAVAGLAARLTASGWGGLAGGLLFAVGTSARTVPLWPSAAPDLLLGLFAALALLGLGGRGPGVLIGALAFACALLAKETALVLLPVALLVAPGWRTRGGMRAVLVLVTAAALVPHVMAALLSSYVGQRFVVGGQVPRHLLELLSAILVPFFGVGEGESPWLAQAGAVRIVLGLALLGVTLALAAIRLGWGTVGRWTAALLLTVALPACSVGLLEPRWLYLGWVLAAPLVAAALLEVAERLGARSNRRPDADGLAAPVAARAATVTVFAALLVLHVLAHGTLLRLKIERGLARDAWVRSMVEVAGQDPPPLAAGDRVEVVVPFGSELRSWPVGIALAIGREVKVEPIDDRTPPTPGVAVIDATTIPARWRR